MFNNLQKRLRKSYLQKILDSETKGNNLLSSPDKNNFGILKKITLLLWFKVLFPGQKSNIPVGATLKLQMWQFTVFMADDISNKLLTDAFQVFS